MLKHTVQNVDLKAKKWVQQSYTENDGLEGNISGGQRRGYILYVTGKFLLMRL